MLSQALYHYSLSQFKSPVYNIKKKYLSSIEQTPCVEQRRILKLKETVQKLFRHPL